MFFSRLALPLAAAALSAGPAAAQLMAGSAAAPMGCYSGSPNHRCFCDADNCDEAKCTGNGFTWTEQCAASDAGPCDCADFAAEPEAAAGPGGCYSGPPNHSCFCDADNCDKEKCTGNGKTWTDQCVDTDTGPCDCADFDGADVADSAIPTILELARATDDFSTLVAAVEAAAKGPAGPNIAEALDAAGTYTLFAPTNDAFAALPEDLVTKLLSEEWQPQLQDVLLYHALDSKVMSTDLPSVNGTEVPTLNGEGVFVSLEPPAINGVNILVDSVVDVEASNGVVHGIESVLTPASISMDIVDMGMASDDHTTLVAAVTAAGLVDALRGDGPLTLLAPTDDAFAALPNGTVDDLLKPENVDTLKGILLHHVVEGNLHSAAVESGTVESLNGTPLEVAVSDDGITVGGANVIGGDFIAKNGIIHVLDKVILPPDEESEAKADDTALESVDPTKNIVEIATSEDGFMMLGQAITQAGLVDALSGEGPFTVFAPNDDAVNALGQERLTALLAAPERLAAILKYHVVSGKVMASDVAPGEVETLNGAKIKITIGEGKVRLNDAAEVIETDIVATNGVIHVIDAIITPPAAEPAPDAAGLGGCYSGQPDHRCFCDADNCDEAKCIGNDFIWTDQCVDTAAGPCDCADYDGADVAAAPTPPAPPAPTPPSDEEVGVRADDSAAAPAGRGATALAAAAALFALA